MQDTRPFTAFVREHRPLADELDRLVAPISRKFQQLDTAADLREFAQSVGALIEGVRSMPPALGGARVAARRRGYWGRRRNDGSRPAVTRHYLAVQLAGDPKLLFFWPTDDEGLTPVDLEEPDEYIGEGDAVWTVTPVDDQAPEPTWALYTHFDLTTEDEAAAAAGQLDLQRLYDSRIASIRPIVQAIHLETQQYFDELLPARITATLEMLQQEFANREAVSKTFAFPDEWILPTPQLATSPTEPRAAQPPQESVNVPYTARLAPASFARLQRTIRVWADAVERYPTAFRSLPEDRISDLLAATLRATLPGAEREVFSRVGKTDILVHANALADGVEPAIVFIAENKWARSRKVVHDAVRYQLFRYLNSSDTSAVLLLMLDQKDRRRSERTYLPELRNVEGYESERASAVSGWPLYRYHMGGRTLEVCVAVIHLPPVESVP